MTETVSDVDADLREAEWQRLLAAQLQALHLARPNND